MDTMVGDTFLEESNTFNTECIAEKERDKDIGKYPKKEVSRIIFTLFSPEDIVKYSVCNIQYDKKEGGDSRESNDSTTVYTTVNGGSNTLNPSSTSTTVYGGVNGGTRDGSDGSGVKYPNTLWDTRMGAESEKGVCSSCGMNIMKCSGHFGHIRLNADIIHPMLYKNVVDILKCFCMKCYRLLISPEHITLGNFSKLTGQSRYLAILEKMKKVSECFYCKQKKQNIIFKTTERAIYSVYTIPTSKTSGTRKETYMMTSKEIKTIFDNVLPSDIALLGLDEKYFHLRKFMISSLPILSITFRPKVVISGSTYGGNDDDRTIQYLDILKVNNKIASNTISLEDKYVLTKKLEFLIATLMDNTKGKNRHTTGNPVKSFKKTISGKEGIIRNNMMGKRTNYSARSVISPDPTIRTDQLSVPRHIANILTIPIRVTSYNIEEVKGIIRRGEAVRLTTTTGGGGGGGGSGGSGGGRSDGGGEEKVILLSYVQDIEELLTTISPGDTIDRKLRDGDVALLNRQPTLHKGSIMAKNIVIRPQRTFSFNLASTVSYNADYDGKLPSTGDCFKKVVISLLKENSVRYYHIFSLVISNIIEGRYMHIIT